MFGLFRYVIDRLKALFATAAAQELEADWLERHAERKAELLRRAEGYEREGLPQVGRELRRQADEVDPGKPLAGLLPALAHWRDGEGAPRQEPAPGLEGPSEGAEPRLPHKGRGGKQTR